MEDGIEILSIKEFEVNTGFQTAANMIPPEHLLQKFYYTNPETDKFPGLFKVELMLQIKIK